MSNSESQPEVCDRLIIGGPVITLDDEGRTFSQGAIAVIGNTIVAIGEAADIESRFSPREILRADDCIVLPGLINSHNHTPLTIVRGMIEDRNFAPSYTSGIPAVHSLTFDETLALARLGCFEMLRSGSTTVVDYFRYPKALAIAAHEMGLRAVIGGRIHDADTEALAQGRYEHRVEIGNATLKETFDLIEDPLIAGDDRIRVDFAPHAADTCSKALLSEVAELVSRHGCNVHTHLAQSPGEVAYVRERDGMAPHEVFAETGLLNPRLIAAHCVFLEPQDVVAAGRAGIAVAHAPHQNVMAGNIAPIRDLEAAGARITLCTDTRSADLFEAMRLAIGSARIRQKGFEPKAPQVLRWATTSPAAALGLDGIVGSLEVGKRADLILLDRRAPNLVPLIDGCGTVVYSGHAANVRTVMVDGRILLHDGQPTLFDGKEIAGQAQAVAARLWRDCGIQPLVAG